jgi:hypothetical protein
MLTYYYKSALYYIFVTLLFAGCVMSGPERIVITATPEPTLTPQPPLPQGGGGATAAPNLTSTPWPYPVSDESVVMSGICFEAALDAADQLFILRNSAEHIAFYDLADNSEFCRRPVTRYPFDFSNGRVLSGFWSYGRGCTARHDVLDIQQDDAAKALTIRLRFVTEGDCPYELVRPFWVGLDGVQDYQIEMVVE